MRIICAVPFRWSVVSACLLLCNVSLAQNVVVEEFTPGTTISSASVNSNFGKLADKANDNATRLGAAESDIAAMVSASTGKQYVWLGYTAIPFDAENDYDYTNNGLTLSVHCKSEFGPDAFVATDIAIQSVVMSGGDFTAPEDKAWYMFLGASNSWTFSNSAGRSSRKNYFFGDVYNLQPGYSVITSKLRVENAVNYQDVWPVACVALR